ncbi:MAG: hypothetical protein ABJM06_13260 [Gilvibacter sp.]
MYFKKQLYFALFIAIVLAALFYKDTTNQKTFNNSETVTVNVVDVHCRNGLKKAKGSWLDIEYNGKQHKFRVDRKRCNSLVKGDTLSLLYHSKSDGFLLPELLRPGYYSIFYILFGVLLAVALIPYRMFIK